MVVVVVRKLLEMEARLADLTAENGQLRGELSSQKARLDQADGTIEGLTPPLTAV